MKEYFDNMMNQIQNSVPTLEESFYHLGYINALRDVGYLSLDENIELADQIIIEGRRKRCQQQETQSC